MALAVPVLLVTRSSVRLPWAAPTSIWVGAVSASWTSCFSSFLPLLERESKDGSSSRYEMSRMAVLRGLCPSGL